MGRLLNVAMCSGCKAKMSEIYQLKRKVEKQARHIAALQKKLNATGWTHRPREERWTFRGTTSIRPGA